MASLTDIARAHGAGPVLTPVYQLERRVVRAARDYLNAHDEGGKTTGREIALRKAVRELEGALESRVGSTLR